MRKRKNPTANKRQRIYNKTDGRCAYCGCEINLRNMQIDHVIPKSRGGSSDEKNLLPVCRSCNHRKGSSTLEYFRHEVELFPAVLMRHSVTYRNAVRFGLVIPNQHEIKFYFEEMRDEKDD